MAFVTKLTIGFLTFSNIVNKELLLVENTPHGHKSFQVYLKGQYSARYFFSCTYINDLPNDIHSSIRLFADDCRLLIGAIQVLRNAIFPSHPLVTLITLNITPS